MQYAIACVIIFSPLFVFAAPPDDVKAGVGDEFEMPEKSAPSTKPKGPEKPYRPDVSERLKLEAKNAEAKLELDSGRGKQLERQINQMESDIATQKRELEILKNTDDAAAKEKILKKMSDKDLPDNKRLAEAQRYSNLNQKNKKAYIDFEKFKINSAERRLANAKKLLESIKKGKGKGLLMPILMAAGLVGYDFSEEAVAGTVTDYFFDIDGTIKQLKERRTVLEKDKKDAMAIKKRYDELNKEIGDIALYLDAFDIRTKEQLNALPREDAADFAAAVKRMTRLETERNMLLALMQREQQIENELSVIEKTIKELEEKKKTLPTIK